MSFQPGKKYPTCATKGNYTPPKPKPHLHPRLRDLLLCKIVSVIEPSLILNVSHEFLHNGEPYLYDLQKSHGLHLSYTFTMQI